LCSCPTGQQQSVNGKLLKQLQRENVRGCTPLKWGDNEIAEYRKALNWILNVFL
jgi:hypothetical protein